MPHLIFGIYLIVTAFILDAEAQNCGPTPQVLPETCCSIPQFFDDSDLIKCKSIRRTRRFATSRMELGTCYLSCVFESRNVTFAGGQVLNTNNLLKILLQETPNEPQSKQVITNAVGQCLSDLNSGVLRIRNPTSQNCSTIPSAIMILLSTERLLAAMSDKYLIWYILALDIRGIRKYLTKLEGNKNVAFPLPKQKVPISRKIFMEAKWSPYGGHITNLRKFLPHGSHLVVTKFLCRSGVNEP